MKTNKQQQKLYLANVIEGSIPLAWAQATVPFGSSSGENKSLHLSNVPHSYPTKKGKCSDSEKVEHQYGIVAITKYHVLLSF